MNQTITAVDGSVIDTIVRVAELAWVPKKGGDFKHAYRLHTQFEVLRGAAGAAVRLFACVDQFLHNGRRNKVTANSTISRNIQPHKVAAQIKNRPSAVGRFQVGIVENNLAEPITTNTSGDIASDMTAR